MVKGVNCFVYPLPKYSIMHLGKLVISLVFLSLLIWPADCTLSKKDKKKSKEKKKTAVILINS